jgi:hypothetical protein
MRAFLEVKNLLDTETVLSGYTRTGSPTNPGTSSYYTLSSTYWDSRNNNNFGLMAILSFPIIATVGYFLLLQEGFVPNFIFVCSIIIEFLCF